MDNRVIEKYFSTEGIDLVLPRILAEISRETGFVVQEEVQRRWIYDPAKTWRVRFKGMYEEKSAILQVDSLKLETDEEEIRIQFREQAIGSRVRPPRTYFFQPFDPAKGYALSLEEDVTDMSALFDPSGSPEKAVSAFVPFYRELQKAVSEPFWPTEWKDAHAFSLDQANAWFQLAQEKDPQHTKRIEPLVLRIRERMLAAVKEVPVCFTHAHLSGSDVRTTESGEWVVLANHFWSWRQPGYDIAFPLWSQWLSLPPDKRSPVHVRTITETWLEAVRHDDLHAMVLNRLYGALLLDIPAKRLFETEAAVQDLENACIAEAERLLLS